MLVIMHPTQITMIARTVGHPVSEDWVVPVAVTVVEGVTGILVLGGEEVGTEVGIVVSTGLNV